MTSGQCTKGVDHVNSIAGNPSFVADGTRSGGGRRFQLPVIILILRSLSTWHMFLQDASNCKCHCKLLPAGTLDKEHEAMCNGIHPISTLQQSTQSKDAKRVACRICCFLFYPTEW
jgi:hypothetical protein